MVAPAALQPAMIDAGESAETARPPGSALAVTAPLVSGKRPFRHAQQRPRRFLLKMLRHRAPAVSSLLVAQRHRTVLACTGFARYDLGSVGRLPVLGRGRRTSGCLCLFRVWQAVLRSDGRLARLLQSGGRSVSWRTGSRWHLPAMLTLLTGGLSQEVLRPGATSLFLLRGGWGHSVLHAGCPLAASSSRLCR